jgi:hypothetical protein
MNNLLVLITPLLVFVLVALLGFVGCGEVLPASADPQEEPPEEPPKKPQEPFNPAGAYKPPTGPHLPPTALTYQDLVTSVTGFSAFWPLNETGGTIVSYVGSLTPPANGEFKNAAGAAASFGSYSLGKEGVLFAKDKMDFAVDLGGTEAFIEVPFVGALNPVSTPTGFSIELWAKPDLTRGADRGGLVSSHHIESATSQQGYEIALLKVPGQAHQQVYGRVYGGASMVTSEISVQPDDGDPSDWRHIVFKYGFVAGKGFQIFLRVQVLKSTPVLTATQVYRAESTTPILYDNVLPAKPSTLRFGGTHLPQNVSAVYSGLLDNIAFYNAMVDDSVFDDHFKMAL